MRIRALVSKGAFVAGREYDLPTPEAQAMIIAGTGEQVDTKALQYSRETATRTRIKETR